MTDTSSSSRVRAGQLLRTHRQSAGITQETLAARAATTQETISRAERGARNIGLDQLDRLFSALGRRLRLEVDTADALLDAELDRLATAPIATILDEQSWPYVIGTLGELPYVIEGPLAALVQGVALPVDAIDLAIPRAELTAFSDWLNRRGARRWSQRWQEFQDDHSSPHLDGPMRWRTGLCEIRARFCARLPASVVIRHDETGYRVRPLAEIELFDGHAARLMARFRARFGAELLREALDSAGPVPVVPDQLDEA